MRIRLRRPKQPIDVDRDRQQAIENNTDGPRINQRQFLRVLGVLGTVGAAQLLTSHPVEAAYENGTAPDGGDKVTTSLTVEGNLTVSGGNVEISNANGGYNGMVFSGDTNWGFAVVNPSSPFDDYEARVSYYSNPGGNRKVGFWDARQSLYPLYVDTNGTNVVVQGNLGIGTPSPQAALDVNGFIRTDGARMLINGFDGNPGFFWFRTTGPEPGSVFMAFGASPGGDAVSILIGPQGSLGAYINDIGQVGIGNVSPAHTLDVSGPIGANGNFGVIFPGTANWHNLSWDLTGNTVQIGVDVDSNGVGTLRIEGNTEFVGTVWVNGQKAIDSTGYAMSAYQANQANQAYYS